MSHPIPSAEEFFALAQRCDSAIQRIVSGQALMRVPVDKTDVDMVLAECKIALESLAAILAEEGMPELAAYYEPCRRDVPCEVVSAEDYDTLRAYTNAQAIKLRAAEEKLIEAETITRIVSTQAEKDRERAEKAEAELREVKGDAESFRSVVLLWAEYTGNHMTVKAMHEEMSKLCFLDAALASAGKE